MAFNEFLSDTNSSLQSVYIRINYFFEAEITKG